MLERLPDQQRLEADFAIGNMIHDVLIDARVRPMAKVALEQRDPELAQSLFRIGICYLASGEEDRWIEPIRDSFKKFTDTLVNVNKEAPPLRNRLEGLPFLLSTGNNALRERALDLLIETVDDSFYWFTLIDLTSTEFSTREELSSHPVLASATSLDDKVHRTAKLVLEKQLEAGVKILLPRSHQDFVEIFHKASYILAELGFALDTTSLIDTSPTKRGRCPAHTKDEVTGQTWLSTLLEVTSEFYTELRDR